MVNARSEYGGDRLPRVADWPVVNRWATRTCRFRRLDEASTHGADTAVAAALTGFCLRAAETDDDRVAEASTVRAQRLAESPVISSRGCPEYARALFAISAIGARVRRKQKTALLNTDRIVVRSAINTSEYAKVVTNKTAKNCARSRRLSTNHR